MQHRFMTIYKTPKYPILKEFNKDRILLHKAFYDILSNPDFNLGSNYKQKHLVKFKSNTNYNLKFSGNVSL